MVRSIKSLHKDFLKDKYWLPILSIAIATDLCDFIILYPLFGRNIFSLASENAVRSGQIEKSSKEVEWIGLPAQAGLDLI